MRALRLGTVPLDLFSRISSEFGRFGQGVEEGRRDPVVTVPTAESDRLATVLFANVRQGGYCTLLVTGHRAWGRLGTHLEGARSAARRGLKIERAYLLPGRYLRHDQGLEKHVDLDVKAGVRTRVLYVGDLIAKLAECSPGSLEFGVWDGETCSMAMYGASETSNGPTEWRVSARAEDVRRARRLADILRAKAEVVTLGDGAWALPPAPDEPLVVSAPIAYRIAPRLCRKDPMSGRDCSWYHGIWQYLRIFDMVSTPSHHAEFFGTALRSLAREGGYRRVLVSGAADYSMLAHVLHAYRMEDVTADVTIIDICETPLFLSRWYAEKLATPVKTHACDILDYDCAKPFDVVCTHSFLRRFTPSSRPSVIAKWRDILKPGGKLVTAGRIGPNRSGDRAGLNLARNTAFRENILRAAEMWREFLAVDLERLAIEAQTYAERPVNHPVGSREEFVELFERGGFTIDSLESDQLRWNPSERTPGLTSPKSATYAHIIATRN